VHRLGEALSNKYEIRLAPETRRRRFPFRTRNRVDAKRAGLAANEALRSVQDMVFSLVKQSMPKDLTIEDVEDLVQECNLHLHIKSLPRYDAWRKPKVKISTFLRACIFNWVRQKRRVVISKRMSKPGRSHTISQSDYPFHTLPAPDESVDRYVEALAADLLSNPDAFLTPHQAAALRAVVDNDGSTMQKLSIDLNYKLPSSFSTMKKKIRERIVELDILGYEGASAGNADT
jgi:DNA-directed RNA polymerase specialized sigma24 family protein